MSELREGTVQIVTDVRGGRPPTPAQWHVEVARDARFNELIADVRGDAARSRVEIPDVDPGTYFMRVSAVDADGFQGPPSEVVSTSVARASSAVDAGGARRVTVSQGLFCSLDGAPLAPVSDAAIEVERRHQHTLRCALDAAGEGAVERVFEALRVGPLRLDASLSTSDATQRTASARVRVLDASGAPVPREGLRVESGDSAVLAGDLTPVQGSAGDYDVALQWARATRVVTLRATFEDEHAEAALALPEEPAAPVAPPPSERWTHRLSARAEGGAAFMLSEFQRNTDPAAFGGNAPALSTGFIVGGRAAFQLLRPDGGTRGLALSLEAGGAYVRFSTGEGSTLARDYASLSIAHGGLRLEHFAGRWRFYLDAHAGAAFTGDLARLSLDAGVGLDVPLGRAVTVGPYARYLHVVQPGDLVTDEDARVLAVGLSISLRQPSPRW